MASPFSVRNLAGAENSFHPESNIQAFAGLKRNQGGKNTQDGRPSSRGEFEKKCQSGGSLPKLPSLKVKQTTPKHESKECKSRDQNSRMSSTRSDPDLSAPRRRRQQEEFSALEFFQSESHELDNIMESSQFRSESAPANLAIAFSKSENDLYDKLYLILIYIHVGAYLCLI